MNQDTTCDGKHTTKQPLPRRKNERSKKGKNNKPPPTSSNHRNIQKQRKPKTRSKTPPHLKKPPLWQTQPPAGPAGSTHLLPSLLSAAWILRILREVCEGRPSRTERHGVLKTPWQARPRRCCVRGLRGLADGPLLNTSSALGKEIQNKYRVVDFLLT